MTEARDALNGFCAGFFLYPHRWDRSRTWFDWLLRGRAALALLLLACMVFSIGVAGYYIGRAIA